MVTIGNKKFYEVEEVQKMFNIKNPRTIYHWIKEGRIKAQKITKRWYIPEEEVKKLLS